MRTIDERIARIEAWRCPNCGESAEWFNLAEDGEAYCQEHTPKTFGSWCRKGELIKWLRSQDARDVASRGSRDRGGSGRG